MIYLVRHGQTDWNVVKRVQGRSDIPLNENGRKQAELASKEIEKLGINKIISSDLIRAKETAEIINKKIGCDIILDERLREVDYGDLEGRISGEFKNNEWDTFNYTPEKLNGESKQHLYNRVESFLNDIKNDKENILVVTHGGVIRMMLYYADNKGNFDNEQYTKFLKETKIDNAGVYKYIVNK